MIGPARSISFVWSIWFIWFLWSIWFVSFISLVWFNQINKTNQTNQMNKSGWRTFSAAWWKTDGEVREESESVSGLDSETWVLRKEVGRVSPSPNAVHLSILI